MRVMVAEDDPALSVFLQKGLELEGHRVELAADGVTAVEQIEEDHPDLLVLDLGLPQLDGVDVLRALRDRFPAMSILVLTGRSQLPQKIECLNLGADDYLIKPFSLHELLARCRAVARRRVGANTGVLAFEGLRMDRITRTVTHGGDAIDFTAKEFTLLEHLLQNKGRAVSRRELLEEVWRMPPDAGTNVVDVYVNYLRRKLSIVGSHDLIQTVRGEGYAISANGNTKQVNHPTTARIPLGGSIERGVPLDIAGKTSFNILLQDADFRSARSVADAINKELGRPAAHASNSRSVELQVKQGEDVPELLSRVEGVEVTLSPRAKVVVNERTGTVVIGGNVALQPASILHGGLAVNIVSEFQVSQPEAFSQGQTKVVQQTQVDVKDKPVNRIDLKTGSTVEDLVRSLQMIGATARDVISILQAMKSAGAVEAEIEVL